jgi:replicative DNA helicase
MKTEERENALSKKLRRNVVDSFQEHGKLPPQAIDMEESVLGALMLEREAINKVIGLLSADCFYKESHQEIFKAINYLYARNEPVDILTVTAELRSRGKIELAGGPFYITQITSRIASSANIEAWTLIIVEKYLARELIKASTEIIRKSFEDSTDVFDLIAEADLAISKVNEYSARGGSFNHVSESTTKSIDGAKRREKLRKEGKTSGITTGLKDLNELTGGWQPTDLIIIAARPGMGKTSLMLKFVLAASEANVPVCVYSLEMSDERLSDNLLLAVSNVEKDKFKNGFMSQDDWSDLAYSKQNLDKSPIYIDSNPSVSMRYIKANSVVMNRKGQCGMILIDYLQLVDVSSDERNRNREQEIAKASREAKIIAKRLNIPVILLCQLSREVEKRPDKKPQLSDLRESGAIEQDADVVLFIYRAEYYGFAEDSAGNSVKGIGKIICAKNRNGATKDVKFRYNESMTKIGDYDTSEQFMLSANTEFDKQPF